MLLRLFQNRRQRKRAREAVHAARKWLRYNEDLLTDAQRELVTKAIRKIELDLRNRNTTAALAGVGDLEQKIGRLFPERKPSAWRENIEVLLVAAIVAMGIRTFFLQPFKIPTGSMQPTLYGMVVDENYDRNASFPKRVVDVLGRGKWPVNPHGNFGSTFAGLVQWTLFGVWPRGATCVDRGDHIFVDRFTYHFRRPRRGEIVVFGTANIPEIPAGSRGKFYIKRLIGLPGDEIRIVPPYALLNGEILDTRPAFARIYSKSGGYSGYVLPDARAQSRYFRSTNDVYRVPADHFFVLGDNSPHSLDGRYWGGAPMRDLVGRAIFVYWPFGPRTGRVD